ncbi:MAG: MFS transporter [Syntrophorhabdaceae bacterium]|nr:MFS transporter [Syntrophorhabdaceae bacterium]MDD5242853.1 MFS transporter [Syntrophorhabdaceae bacterium]
MLNGLSIKSRQKVLVVFGAALGLACGFGPAFFGTLGILLKQMAASFNWGRGDIAVLPMVGMLGASIGAPLIGYIADRKGWNKVILFSVVLFALGLLAVSVAPVSYAYIIAVGLFTGIVGVGTTPAGYIAVISLAFDRRLGMALGLAAIGTGVGSMAMPIIVSKLIEVMDWRQAYLCVSGLILLFGLSAHQLIFRSSGAMKSNPGSNKTSLASKKITNAGVGISFYHAIAGYRFWVIGIATVFAGGITMGALVHLVSYATDRGIGPAFAAQSAAWMGFGIAAARTGVGFILDKIFAPIVACVALFLGATGLYLLSINILPSVWILPLAAILVGVATGAEGDLVPFLVKKYFGVVAFGSIYGTLMGAVGFGSGVGSYAYGWSFDLFKSYIPAFQVSAILLCACGLALLTLGRYQYARVEVPQDPGDIVKHAEPDC